MGATLLVLIVAAESGPHLGLYDLSMQTRGALAVARLAVVFLLFARGALDIGFRRGPVLAAAGLGILGGVIYLLVRPLPVPVAMLEANGSASGQALYDSHCGGCHGAFGVGTSHGPGLADPVWLHGGSPSDIRRVIEDGVPGTAKTGWRGVLADEEIEAVAAYVVALSSASGAAPGP